MSVLYNRVYQNTATTGTGTLTLGAAVSAKFFTAAELSIPDGTLVSYELEEGTNVEIGIGTMGSSGTTLARTTVTKSKIAGTVATTKITLLGAATVALTVLAADIVVAPTAGASDNRIVRFDADGNHIQESIVTIDDSGSQLASISLPGAALSLTLQNSSSAGSSTAELRLISNTTSVYLVSRNDIAANVLFAVTDALLLQTNAAAPIYVQTNNVERMRILSTGETKFGSDATPDRWFHIEKDDAATAAIVQLLRLTVTSSGTPAIGFGVGLEFESETSAGVLKVGASIYAPVINVGVGTETFILGFGVMENGAVAEVCRMFPDTLAISQTRTAPIELLVWNQSTNAAATAKVRTTSGTASEFKIESKHADALTYAYATVGALNLGSLASYISFVSGGSGRGVIDPTFGFWGLGTLAPDRPFHAEFDNPATATVSYIGRFTSTSSGTPAVGIGVGIELEVETAAGNNEVGATIEAVMQLGTSTAEIIALNGKQMAAGALQESFGISFLAKVITANVAYSNVNTVQPWFPSGGALTVEGGTTYEFEGILAVITTGASTTHTTGLSFTGTATLTSIAYRCASHFQLANTTMSTSSATLSNLTYVTQAANTVVSGLSGVTSAQQQIIHVRGIIRINAAGTLIPNFTFSAAPGAGNVLANTFFKLRKVGTGTVVNQGNWA